MIRIHNITVSIAIANYCITFYFNLVVVISSDVSRSSFTTYFTPLALLIQVFSIICNALVMHGAAVHSMYCLIIAFIPAVKKTKIYRVHAAATNWGQNSTWWFVHDSGLYKMHSSVHS